MIKFQYEYPFVTNDYFHSISFKPELYLFKTSQICSTVYFNAVPWLWSMQLSIHSREYPSENWPSHSPVAILFRFPRLKCNAGSLFLKTFVLFAWLSECLLRCTRRSYCRLSRTVVSGERTRGVGLMHGFGYALLGLSIHTPKQSWCHSAYTPRSTRQVLFKWNYLI